MINKITLSLFASLFLFTSSYAEDAEKLATKKTYDEKGWWWYEESYKNPKTNEVEKIKYQVTPAEKAKLDKEEDTNKLLKTLILKVDENTKVNKAVLKRLEYAYPNTTPEYSVDSKTGKKCLTNSSSTCFIMPVIAEGQHVPVLKNFLRNPSPENSKEWLKWQATYFNHVQKVSHGLRFAFLKDGGDVYETTTDYTYGDNMYVSNSENVRELRESKVLVSLKDRLAYLVFLGQNDIFEQTTDIYKKFVSYKGSFIDKMDYVIIFASESQRQQVLDYTIRTLGKEQGYKDVGEFFKKVKTAVRPDLYQKYNVRVTPSTLIFYSDPSKKEKLWQIIETGKVSVDSLRSNSISFLKYNGIIDEKEFSADKNWETNGKSVLKLNKIKQPNPSTDFNQIEEDIKKLEEENN